MGFKKRGQELPNFGVLGSIQLMPMAGRKEQVLDEECLDVKGQVGGEQFVENGRVARHDDKSGQTDHSYSLIETTATEALCWSLLRHLS